MYRFWGREAQFGEPKMAQLTPQLAPQLAPQISKQFFLYLRFVCIQFCSIANAFGLVSIEVSSHSHVVPACLRRQRKTSKKGPLEARQEARQGLASVLSCRATRECHGTAVDGPMGL